MLKTIHSPYWAGIGKQIIKQNRHRQLLLARARLFIHFVHFRSLVPAANAYSISAKMCFTLWTASSCRCVPSTATLRLKFAVIPDESRVEGTAFGRFQLLSNLQSLNSACALWGRSWDRKQPKECVFLFRSVFLQCILQQRKGFCDPTAEWLSLV